MSATRPSPDPEAPSEVHEEQRDEVVESPHHEPVEGLWTPSDRMRTSLGHGAPMVLVGAPGSGKSTVGALLADRLGVEFLDVDAVIEERIGKSVAQIFAEDGEPAFRQLEERTTAELLRRPCVVALGGGAVLSAATRKALQGHRVVWLRVGAPAALSRIGLDTARPLLLGNVRGRLIKLLGERTPLYEEVASARVDTDNASPAEVVELVVDIWRPD